MITRTRFADPISDGNINGALHAFFNVPAKSGGNAPSGVTAFTRDLLVRFCERRTSSTTDARPRDQRHRVHRTQQREEHFHML